MITSANSYASTHVSSPKALYCTILKKKDHNINAGGNEMGYDYKEFPDEDMATQVSKGIGSAASSAFEIEMMRRLKNKIVDNVKAIDNFRESTEKESLEMRRLSKWMMWLTIGIGCLTVIQVILGVLTLLLTN